MIATERVEAERVQVRLDPSIVNRDIDVWLGPDVKRVLHLFAL